MRSTLYESNSLMVYDCRTDRSIPPGEVTIENGFHKNDWKWAAGEQAMKRTSDALAKNASIFRVFAMMNTGGHRDGIRAIDALKKDDPSLESPNHINVMLGNNVSSLERHIPLTPWMCLHRAMHCIQADSKFRVGLTDPFQALIQFCRDRKMTAPPTLLDLLGPEGGSEYQSFIYTILTTRCARKGNLSQVGDASAELLAQCFFGGIKFLKTEDWEERGELCKKHAPEWRHYGRDWRLYPTLCKMFGDAEATDKALVELENQLNESVRLFAQSLVGRTIRF